MRSGRVSVFVQYFYADREVRPDDGDSFIDGVGGRSVFVAGDFGGASGKTVRQTTFSQKLAEETVPKKVGRRVQKR